MKKKRISKLGKILKDIRINLGLTRAALALKLKITPQSIYAWEIGKFNMKPKHFPKVIKLAEKAGLIIAIRDLGAKD